MFWTKLIVALVLLPGFLWVWWQGAPYFNGLMLIFAAVAADEVVTMSLDKHRLSARVAAAVSAVIIYASLGFEVFWSLPAAFMLALLLSFLVHLALPGDVSAAGGRVAINFLAAAYGGLPIAYLVMLRADPVHGRGLAFTALAVSWLCDTFAYAGGRAFGRHKLYPKISPHKTVEGLVTGMLAAGAGAAASAWVFKLPAAPWVWGALGFFGGAWGQVGDLAESLLKRSFGVKDSGGLLPGHGGVLDRFDAVLFVAPLFYAAYHLL